MGCTLKDIKDNALVKVRSIAMGNANVTSLNESNDVIITPSLKSTKVNTIEKAYKMAQQKVEAINKWSENTFGSAKYNNQWVTIYSTPNHVRMSFSFPTSLEMAYQKKFEIEEARNVQREDAKRMNIEQDYQDDYMFDALPNSAEGYHYSVYVAAKEIIRNKVNQRIKVLEEMPSKDVKAHMTQIVQLKELERRLTKDLKNLQSETRILSNFFNYFYNDLNNIEEILLNNPSVENIVQARNFLENIKVITNTSGTRFATDNPFKSENEEITTLFDNFQKEMSLIEKKISILEEEIMEKQIDTVLDDKSKEVSNLADDLDNVSSVLSKSNQNLLKKGINLFQYLTLPIDGTIDASKLQIVLRRIYDNAIAKKPFYSLISKLHNIRPGLEKELQRLGYGIDSGFFGVLGSKVSYDIFKRKDSAGRHRLINQYSDNWINLEQRVDKLFKEIRKITFKKNKDKQDFASIKKMRNDLFKQLDNVATFIDVRKIPELRNHIDLQESFGNFFADETVCNEYKEQLIQSLDTGNRQSAERLYNQAIEKQLEKLISFELSMASYKDRLFKKYGVDELSELSEQERNNFLQAYYTQSPFAFAENYEQNGNSYVRKIFYAGGQRAETTDISTLEFQVYIPKVASMFDNGFQNIQSNPILYEAWELFHDAITTINRNRKYAKSERLEIDDVLTSHHDFYKEHSAGILGLTSYFAHGVLDNIKNVFRTNRYKDITKLKLNGTVKSIDEVIKSESRQLIAILSAMGVNMKETYTVDTFPADAKKFLQEQYNIEFGQIIVPSGIVKNIAEKKVLNTQKMDLIETLTSQLETVEKFKAHKEIEVMMKFIQSQAKLTEDATTLESINKFIENHLYGVNNRQNWTGMTIGPSGKQSLNHYEKAAVVELKRTIKLLNDILSTVTDDKVRERISNDIQEMQSLIDNMGKVVTTGSVYEGFFIRAQIYAGLGFNFASQVHNLSIGNLALRQNEGLEWTEGNGQAAFEYTKKLKILKRKFYKGENVNDIPDYKRKYAITNTLISSLGIFQNSANEIDRIAETGYKTKAGKHLNPLYIIGEVEKTIQRPQILAVLGDVYIEDTNGNSVPVFNVADTTNPHPAFDLDANGNLILKPEFNTEDNRKTWIERNSDEYASLFGESGKIPRIIAKINGDYRKTSDIGAKHFSLLASLMIFKTWLPAYIQRRYGKEEGVITKLIEHNRAGQAYSINTASQAMLLGTGASILNPVLGVTLAMGFLGYKKIQMMKKNDLTVFHGMLQEIRTLSIKNNFLVNSVKLSAAIGQKMYQQLGYTFGKEWVTNENINWTAGYGQQNETETAEEFMKNQHRLQFLMTEAAAAASVLMIKLLANMLLFPDDDEEKEFKDATVTEKITKHPDLMLYYALENFTTRFQSEVNLGNSPEEVAKTALFTLDDSFTETMLLVTSLVEQIPIEGLHATFQSGENEGKNKFAVRSSQFFLPKGIDDLAFGFGSYTTKDKTKGDLLNRKFESDAKQYTRKWKAKRAEERKKLETQLEEQYPGWSDKIITREATKVLDNKYPSIKHAFDSKGQIKKGYESEVKRYE